jgi:hypothetical protein
MQRTPPVKNGWDVRLPRSAIRFSPIAGPVVTYSVLTATQIHVANYYAEYDSDEKVQSLETGIVYFCRIGRNNKRAVLVPPPRRHADRKRKAVFTNEKQPSCLPHRIFKYNARQKLIVGINHPKPFAAKQPPPPSDWSRDVLLNEPRESGPLMVQ